MLREGREHERKHLTVEHDDTCFYIETPTGQWPCDDISNVTVHGAGVRLPVFLAVGTAMVLDCHLGEHHVRVQGLVMWCRSEDSRCGDSAYRVGLRFNPRDVRNSSLLFLALRSYG